ncbi:MAG: PKD domain-containing protein, partial [Planctomycetota bacterium]
MGAVDEDSTPGATFSPPKTVNVIVTATQVSAEGPYTIAEGESLSLAADADGAPTGFDWDVNNDGNFSDAVGQNTTLGWTDLQALIPGIDGFGLFFVRVRATYPNGSQVISNVTFLVVVNTPPTATLSNNGPVQEGDTALVSFSGQFDPSDVDTAVGFTYSYDFDNDGLFELTDITSASATVPSSFLNDNGIHMVLAIIKDKDGDFTELFTDIAVLNVEPSLNLLGVDTVEEGAPYALMLSATDPGDDTISRWIVDWGDGTIEVFLGPNQTLTHGFADDGLREISVTAVDEDGLYGATKTVTPTLLNLSATNAGEGDFVRLTGTLVDPGILDSFVLEVDWGDGALETFNLVAGTTDFELVHAYADDDPSGTPADDYLIDAVVTDDDAGEDSASALVTVTNVAPSIAGLGLAHPSIDESGLIVLSGAFTDVGIPDTHTVTIDWGDGNTSTADVDAASRTFTATHRYVDDDPTGTSADDYTITATVVDDDGGEDTASTILTVTNVAPAITTFDLSATLINENNTVTVAGSYIDLGSLDTVTLSIDWGDGTISAVAVDQIAGTFTASHTYLDDNPTGTPTDDYILTATITDDDGDSNSVSFTVTVNNVAPSVEDLQFLAPVIDENGSAQLTGRIVDVGSLDTHTVSIDWGDGSTSAGVVDPFARTFTATHQYLDDNPSGTPSDDYVVTATVTDDDGGVG